MWSRRSHILQTLIRLPSEKVKFKLKEVEHRMFDGAKQVVERTTLLDHPYFNNKFDIHTDVRYL